MSNEGNGNGFHRAGAVLNKEQFEARLQSHVENALASRSEFFRRMLDPRRNLEEDCGYPSDGTLTPWFYRDLYDREPVAERVVSLMPKECWQTSPEVYEDEDPDNITPFEEAWDDLSKQLRGNGSYFQDQEGSPIWEYLYRVDKLSGICNFGVLLMGFDDGRPLHEPVEGLVSKTTVGNAYAASIPRISKEEMDYAKRYAGETKSRLTINLAVSTGGQVYRDGQLHPLSTLGTEAQYFEPLAGPTEYPSVKPSGKKRKLMFLRPFDQSLVQVSQYEGNMLNPRFGQPNMYRVTLNDPREYQNSGSGLSLATVQVHWTRVLHVADNLNASEVMGAPRMRPVLNSILDVRKVRGGSAEMYWKGAFPGIALSTHPQLGGDVPVDEGTMKDMMENYMNTLQRWMLLVGMNATTLSPTVVDPTEQVNVQIEAICIQLGCPVRVFRGSERGELASTQDDSAWNDRLRHRQNNYITPRMIVPFIDRLIMVGVLPTPKKKAKEDKPKVLPKPPMTPPLAQEKPQPAGLQRNAETGKLEVPKDEDPSKEKVETKGGYSVSWPDLDSLGEKDRSAIASSYTTALAAYVSGGIDQLIPPKSFLTHFVNFDEQEAQAIIDEQERYQEEEMEKHAELAEIGEENELQPLPPTGFENKPPPPPPMPGMPGGPPRDPVKLGAGQSLVQPDTGKTVAKTPFPPKPPTKNLSKFIYNVDDSEGQWITIKGTPVLIKDGEIVGGPPNLVSKKIKIKGAKKDKTKSSKPKTDDGHRDLGTTPEGKERDTIDKLLNSPEVLKGLEIPEKMYHVTSKENLKSILKDGLKFGAPRASKEGEIRGVYLTDNPDDIAKQGGDIGGGDTVVLEVSTRGLNLRLDPEYFYYGDKTPKGARDYIQDINDGREEYALYNPQSIPATHIRVRGGTRNTVNVDLQEYDQELTEIANMTNSTATPVITVTNEVVTVSDDWPTVFNSEELADLPTENCGGPGSGVPGPCPGGGSSVGERIELSSEDATQMISKLRSGDARSKNKGSESNESPFGPAVLTTVSLKNLPEEVIQLLQESTNPERVVRYTKENVKDPVVLFKRRKVDGFGVSDGGHRILAAIARGEDHIRAIIPAKDEQSLVSNTGVENCGGAGGTMGPCPGGGQTHKEIRKEIKDHLAYMKAVGIKKLSMMNPQPSMEAMHANEKLFALKLRLEQLGPEGKGSTSHVKEFLSQHDVTPKGFSNFGPMTKQATVDKYNTQHKTKLSVEDFQGLVGNSNPEGHNQYTDNPSSQESVGHAEKLKAISDEFVKGTGTHAEMNARVDTVLSMMTGPELKEAAAKFGSRSAKGRKERVEGIKRFISDRREMFRRTTHNEGCEDVSVESAERNESEPEGESPAQDGSEVQ